MARREPGFGGRHINHLTDVELQQWPSARCPKPWEVFQGAKSKPLSFTEMCLHSDFGAMVMFFKLRRVPVQCRRKRAVIPTRSDSTLGLLLDLATQFEQERNGTFGSRLSILWNHRCTHKTTAQLVAQSCHWCKTDVDFVHPTAMITTHQDVVQIVRVLNLQVSCN